MQIALAEGTVALVEGDEPRAAATMQAALAEHPVDDQRNRGAWTTGVGIAYVLVPDLRPVWDAAQGPPGLLAVRDLAAAVVAGREAGHDDPIASIDVSNPSVVHAALPYPLAAEVAVRLHEAGRTAEAMAVLEPLGEPGRAHVRALGTRAAKAMLAAVPAAPTVPVQVQALGALLVDGKEVDRVRVRELLGYLLLHRTATRGDVMAVLWPDLDDRAGANNLRVTLSHLLHVIEPERTEGEAAYTLRLGASELRLVTGTGLRVDLDAFDAALGAAQAAEADGTPSVALEQLLLATDLYRGDLLADLPDVTWADIEREGCRSRFVAAAVRAAELLAASNELDRAEGLARRALTVDEWSEPAYGVLTSVALARGDWSAALRVLELCQTMLHDLGVEPSDATRRLVRRARSSAQVVYELAAGYEALAASELSRAEHAAHHQPSERGRRLELVAEGGVGDRHEGMGALADGATAQLRDAVLGHHLVDGVLDGGDRRALGKSGDDAGHRAVRCRRGEHEEALAAG